MTRVMRLALLLTVGFAMTTIVPPEALAADTEPVRSGTILGGVGLETGGGPPLENPAAQRSGCEYAAECRAWLQSGCNPALAGVDPVLTASIVGVRALADGRTTRSLDMVAPSIPPWGLFPGAVVQFWRNDCTELPGSKVHTVGKKTPTACTQPRGYHVGSRCTFRIPIGVRWMTLSGYATTVHLAWTLE